jgi:hypothetical protein
MMDDPIVDEIRKAGEAYFAQFNFNLHAICDDLRRRSEARGVKTVSLPPRKPTPQPRPGPEKKVG